MRRLARLAGLGAIAGTLAIAAPAAAAITSSDITTPGDLSHVLVDRDNGGGSFAVSGTAQGASAGDKVDIACAAQAGSTPSVLATDVPVDIPAGTFSTSVPTSGLDYRTPCVLRAEPAGSGTSAEPPGTSSSFTGPRLLTGGRFTNHLSGDPNKPAIDFSTDTAKLSGKWHHEVTGGCAISSGGLFDTATLTTGPGVFVCNAWLLNANTSETDNVGTRSQLKVDGVNAYLPGGALLNQGAPHFPGVSVSSFSFDPANGDITEHTVEPVVRCAGSDPNPYPANSSNCPDFTTTGVQVHTFITDRGDGTRSLVAQRFESSDGGTHQIDALFDQEFGHPAQDGGLRFPWVDSAYRRYDEGNTVTPPPAGPGSMLAKFDRTAADGTVAGSQGAETWAAAPDSILFLVGTDPSVTIPYSEVETGYHRTVGPSAPTWFGWAFGLGTTPAAVQSAAHDAEVSFTPRVAVTAPADGSSTTSETAHVTGTSSDDSGDAVAVSVNGNPATVGADGAWTVDVPLALGVNTLTATATNRYGNTSTAQTMVTRTQPTTPGPGPTPSPHTFSGVIYVGHKTLRPSGSGVVVLPVRCPAVALGACSGTLSLRGGKPRFAFGSSAFKMAPGKRAKIRIRLTRRARRLLARHSRVTIHLTVTSRDAGAVARARHWALTLKPPIRTRLR